MTAPAGQRAVGAARAVLGATRGTGARRVQWGVVDQGVSSLTNFAIMVVVARETSPRGFGAFSLAVTLYVFFLWASRSLATEPFVVRGTGSPPAEQAAAARQVVGTALTIGAALAAVGVVAGAVAGSPTGAVLVAMALSMPGLLAQDAYRYVLFTAGRPRSAAANDALWLLVQSCLVAALTRAGEATATALVGAFGCAAALSAVVGARQTGVVPSPGSWWQWVRTHRDLGVPFVLELVAVTGMMQLALVAVAVTLGTVAIGQLRGAMLLLGPLTVVFLGLFVVSLPEAVRLRRRSSRGFVSAVVGMGIGMPLVAVLWTAGLSLVPTSAGVELLGANWAAARHVLLPVAVLTAGHSCALAAIVGLRALGAARHSLRARLWGAPVFLAGGIAGSWIDGAYGAAAGLAVGAWVDALLAWIAFGRAFSGHEWDGEPEVSVGPAPLAV